LSITIAPSLAAIGDKAKLASPPAEKRAISISVNAPSSAA